MNCKFVRMFQRFAMGKGFTFRTRVKFATAHFAVFHAGNCDCVECE